MKRALIYFGVIIFVFGSIILSFFTQNSIYIYIMFGSFFLLAFLSLPLYFRRFHKEYKRQEQMKTPEVIEEINEGYDSKLQYDVSQVKNVVDIWKNSSKADIIKGTLFLIVFIGCIISCMICMGLGHLTLGFIFFGSAFGVIFLALIIVKLLETRAIKPKKGRTYHKDTATVLTTTISSQNSYGSNRYKRVGNTTYKVFLKMNGEKITTYSKEYYSAGEKVMVLVDDKKPKVVQIIDRKVDIFDLDDEKF